MSIIGNSRWNKNNTYVPPKNPSALFTGSLIKTLLKLGGIFSLLQRGQTTYISRDIIDLDLTPGLSQRRQLQGYEGCTLEPDFMFGQNNYTLSQADSFTPSMLESNQAQGYILAYSQDEVVKCGYANKNGTGFSSAQTSGDATTGVITHEDPILKEKSGGGYYVFHLENGFGNVYLRGRSLDDFGVPTDVEKQISSVSNSDYTFKYKALDHSSGEWIFCFMQSNRLLLRRTDPSLISQGAITFTTDSPGTVIRECTMQEFSNGNVWVSLDNAEGTINELVYTPTLAEVDTSFRTVTGTNPQSYNLPSGQFLYAYRNAVNKPVLELRSATGAVTSTTQICDIAVKALNFIPLQKGLIGLSLTVDEGETQSKIIQAINPDGSLYGGDFPIAISNGTISGSTAVIDGDDVLHGAIENGEFVVRALTELQDPTISYFNPISVFVGSTQAINLSEFFTDPQDLPLSFEVTNSDDSSIDGLSFINLSGSQLNFTPQAGDQGTRTFKVKATNSRGRTVTQNLTLEIPQRSPVLDPIVNQTMYIGNTTDIPLTFSDPDPGTVLTPVITIDGVDISSVSYASYNSTTMTITLSPAQGDEQTAAKVVQVSISDESGIPVTQSFNLQITNRFPQITAIEDKTMNIGDNLEVSVLASDPDTGTSLTTTVTIDGTDVLNVPYVSYSSSTNRISFTPLEGAQGDHLVVVSVSDGSQTVTESFNANILNRDPQIEAIQDLSLSVGMSKVITIIPTDQDGATPIVSITVDGQEISSVSYASFNSGTNEITFTGEANKQGNHLVELTVTDPQSATGSTSFNVDVPFGTLGFSDNTKFTIQGTPGQTVIIQPPSVTNEDGNDVTFEATGLPTWLAIDANTGVITGTIPADSTQKTLAGTMSLRDFSGVRDTLEIETSILDSFDLTGPEKIKEFPHGGTFNVPLNGYFQLDLSGTYFQGATSHSLTGYPAGLIYNSVNRMLSGVLENLDEINLLFSGTNSNGASSSMSLTVGPLPREAYIPDQVGIIAHEIIKAAGDRFCIVLSLDKFAVVPLQGLEGVLTVNGTTMSQAVSFKTGGFDSYTAYPERDPKEWLVLKEKGNNTVEVCGEPTRSDTTGAVIVRTIRNEYGSILHEIAIKVDSFSNLQISTIVFSVLGIPTFIGGCLWRYRKYKKNKTKESRIKKLEEDNRQQKEESSIQLVGLNPILTPPLSPVSSKSDVGPRKIFPKDSSVDPMSPSSGNMIYARDQGEAIPLGSPYIGKKLDFFESEALEQQVEADLEPGALRADEGEAQIDKIFPADRYSRS